MRYVVTLFLGALLVIVGGLSLDYLSLDFSAPEDFQLTASGSLAYYNCYYEGDCEWETDELPPGPIVEDPLDDEMYQDPWYVFPEDQDLPPPPEDEWYLEEHQPIIIDDDLDGPLYDVEGPYYMDDHPLDAYAYEDVVVYEEPWYVQSFPGIGRMVQQMIPGAVQAPRTVMTAPVPAPPPPQQQQRIIYPQPSCWVSANPTTVPYGGSSVLQWNTFNASRVSFNDVGDVPAQGSRTVSPITSDRTYTLSVLGQGGNGSCYARVSLDRGNLAMPSCVISAHPTSISRGQSASLAWVSSNARSAVLSGTGAVALSGGTFVTPQTTTTYILTVSDALGRTSSCNTKISVAQ